MRLLVPVQLKSYKTSPLASYFTYLLALDMYSLLLESSLLRQVGRGTLEEVVGLEVMETVLGRSYGRLSTLLGFYLCPR